MAGLRTFGKYITDENVREKRVLAEQLRNDAELLTRTKAETGKKLESFPVMAKGVGAKEGGVKAWWWGAAALVAVLVGVRRR